MVARPKIYVSIFYGATAPSGPWLLHCGGFTFTLRNTKVGRTPLDEWSSRHRDLYLTIYNTHNRQTFMPSAEFEPAIPASEQPQTHASGRTATGVGFCTNKPVGNRTLSHRVRGQSLTANQHIAGGLRNVRKSLLLPINASTYQCYYGYHLLKHDVT